MAFRQSREETPVPRAKPGRGLRALGELLREQDPEPFSLFDASLELLTRHFMVDHAMIAKVSQGKLDTFWWVQAGTGAQEPLELHQGLHLCERVMQEPEGCLALGTVFPSEGGPWLRSFAGVILREQGMTVGALAVLNRHPFVFAQDDLDFMRSVAGLIGRVLELENLKYEFQMAQDALALSAAVVQDSALESNATGLPNARYLDVWTQAYLHHARRYKETLSLVLWEQRGDAPKAALREFSKGLRGNDLLVELGPGRYLLLLPMTLQEGAEVVLGRLGAELGHPPMGATLWMPDRDDIKLRAAMMRAGLALKDAAREGGGLRWKLPVLVTPD